VRSLAISLLFLSVTAVLQAGDLSGTWSADVVLDAGSGTATFVFQQQGEALNGTYSGVLGEAKVTGTVMGDKVEWSFDGGQAGKVSFQGTLDGPSKMKGTAEYGLLGKGTFTAVKK
jgi:carbon monoxide dehydrogenase subunit G